MKRIVGILAALALSAAPAFATSCAPSNTQVIQNIISATGTAAAGTATATLAAPTGGHAWNVTGIEIFGLGATGATAVVATVTGLQGGTLSFSVAVPAGATTAITPVVYNPACPLTGNQNTAIVLSIPTFGAGNTSSIGMLHGFQQ